MLTNTKIHYIKMIVNKRGLRMRKLLDHSFWEKQLLGV